MQISYEIHTFSVNQILCKCCLLQGCDDASCTHSLEHFIIEKKFIPLFLQIVLKIFNAIFTDEDGSWDANAMQSALKGKYQHISVSDNATESIFDCFINCISPKQP
jgi:hypothetical protein